MTAYFSIIPSAAHYNGLTLAPGASSAISLQFDPGIPGATVGIKTANLLISSDDLNSPTTVQLIGQVTTDSIPLDTDTWWIILE